MARRTRKAPPKRQLVTRPSIPKSTLGVLVRGDRLQDVEGTTWHVIGVHPPYNRRGAAVTILDERDNYAVWSEVVELEAAGFTKLNTSHNTTTEEQEGTPHGFDVQR